MSARTFHEEFWLVARSVGEPYPTCDWMRETGVNLPEHPERGERVTLAVEDVPEAERARALVRAQRAWEATRWPSRDWTGGRAEVRP